MLDKVRKKLASWKKSFFSKGGVTLIRFVLSGIPVYFFSLFRVPNAVFRSLEKLMRDFLWGGDHLGSWETVGKPVGLGGLKLGNLNMRNRALLAKWL